MTEHERIEPTFKSLLDELRMVPDVLIPPCCESHAFEVIAAWLRIRADHQRPDELLTLLAEAVKAVEDFIDDDPERAGSSFINTGCNDCTQGNTPSRFNTGLCWRHKAARLLKEKS